MCDNLILTNIKSTSGIQALDSFFNMRSSNGELGIYPNLFVGQIITDRGSGQ